MCSIVVFDVAKIRSKTNKSVFNSDQKVFNFNQNAGPSPFQRAKQPKAKDGKMPMKWPKIEDSPFSTLKTNHGRMEIKSQLFSLFFQYQELLQQSITLRANFLENLNVK
ncbi:MAG: hypothetical protein J5506_07870 [Prevotella sp.]|nr:hypothetical protein [Prevotella sp.]